MGTAQIYTSIRRPPRIAMKTKRENGKSHGSTPPPPPPPQKKKKKKKKSPRLFDTNVATNIAKKIPLFDRQALPQVQKNEQNFQQKHHKSQ